MKTPIFFLCAIATTTLTLHAEIITQWNFNSNPPDGMLGTGTTMPSIGSGSATLIGGTTATFATGSTNDPAPSSDNTGWNTTSYPAITNNNKTAGVRFNVSTRSYTNIVVSWDQRPSNTASRYARLQYTTNGIDFVDSLVVNLPVANNPFFGQSQSFAGVLGVDDNTNFAIRIVTEFESTATGSGTNAYVTASSITNYTSAGTMRFDLVTISGDLSQPGNTPPTISDIPDQTTVENTPTGDIAFTIGDAETPLNLLMLTASSSNTNLVPNGNIHFGGDGDFRTVNITPAANQIGTTTITITVTDEGGRFTNDTFVLTVNPANFPPTISAIPHQSTLMNIATPAISFTIADVETPLDNLMLSASSSNPTLVPTNNVGFGGAGGDRTVTITPATGQTGTVALTISVSDGNRSASSSFVLMVVPATNVVLCETFGYLDGSLITNSAFFWMNHSGTAGETPVTSERAGLTFARGEDLHVPLLRSPFATDSGVTLYARYDVTFTALPLSVGEYAIHYNSSGNFKCRVYAHTTNAAAGSFRLGIANGSGNFTSLPLDLNLNTPYTIVTRYVVGSAASTLWVNPTDESDLSATATDGTSAVAIQAFSMRQASGIGTMVIDNIKVGTSLDAVITVRPRLQITSVLNEIEISWPASAEGYVLQSTLSLAPASWMDVPQEPMVSDGRKIIREFDVTGNKFFRLIKPSP